MDNELSQLDALIESDVLDALGKNSNENSTEELDGIIIEDHIEDTAFEDTEFEDIKSQNIDSQNLELSSASLTKLLSELLNNKTIEITIKIKD